MSTDGLPGQLLLQAVLILLNAVFASAEIAVISLNSVALKQSAGLGNKKALRLVKLTEQPSKFLATIQIGVTLAGFLASAFAADNFAKYVVEIAINLGIDLPINVLNTIAVILITLLLSFLTLVFGELVPKRVAMKKAESLAMALSGFLYFVSVIAKPLVSLLSGTTNFFVRMFGIDPDDNEERVTEEEILLMVGAGTESGTIDVQEKAMIENVFAFDNTIAGDIMVHRTDLNLLWRTDTLEEWERTFQNSNHSRLPVCDNDVDDIIGIMYLKDFYTAVRKGITDVEELCTLIKPAYFVPETVKIDLLFRNMQRTKNHFAVVVDDYGGVSGIITMSDILGEIVGDIGEDDDDTLDVIVLDDSKWRVRGITQFDDLEMIPFGELDEDYETVGGLVLGLLGELPEEDEDIPDLQFNGLNLKVTEIRGRRVEWVEITKLSDEGEGTTK
ncbi:MAG: HlyC/CorC family transporter [Clostridiales bacterium]|nr:HlyC/CorC family transporter [Clostridiales bacterium]